MARITPAGERVFYYRYTAPNGERVRLRIGSYDPTGPQGLTTKAARLRADEYSKLYLQGHRDLRAYLAQVSAAASHAEKLALQAAADAEAKAELERSRRLTVRHLFERWRSIELKPHMRADGRRAGRKDGGQYTFEQFNRHIFPKLGDVAAADLRKADILTILDALKEQGKLRTCNVLLADVKQMMRFALARDIIERSPVETVTKRDAGGADVERKRTLSDSEIRVLWNMSPTANLGPRTFHAVWVILATACRVSELMQATWKDVDLANRRWHLPETKNQRPHSIHLSPFALTHFKALEAIRERAEDGALLPWVFPNSRGDGPVCPKSIGKQVADRQKTDERLRLKNRCKRTMSLCLEGGHWTLHDLRRTAATVMARLGFSTDVIDECLNHMLQSRISRVYIQDRRWTDQTRAFDALGAYVEAIIEGGAASNVVSLPLPA